MERWADIGPLLKVARADMKVGQLLAGEAFSLFEAMSALEVGNPRMDAAASPSADRPALEAVLADPSVAPWDLPFATLIAVLDQLLAMEASWHCGGSAIQTVYACLYMLKLDRNEELKSLAARALHAYCRTLQYDCAAVRDLVMNGGVCEEEDINVFTSGIPFEPPVGAAAAAVAGLDAAVSELEAHGTSAPSGEGPAGGDSGDAATVPGPAAAGPGSGAANVPCGRALSQAVALRLKLRRAVHMGLREAASDDPKVVSGSAAHFAEARRLLGMVQGTATLAAPTAPEQQQPAAAPLSSSPPSTASATTSSSSPSPSPSQSSSSGSGSGGVAPAPALAPGFQIDINRHLLGPAPPRQVRVFSVGEALSYFEGMLDHLQVAVTIPEQVHEYRSLQLYLWRFARMRPGAIARSVMHWLLLPDRWQGSSAAQPEQQQQQPQPQRQGGGGGGGRKGGAGGRKGAAPGQGAASGRATSTLSQPQPPQTPPWVPSKEMIAAACQVSYKAGLHEEAELFFEQAVIAVTNVCQAILMNRCRCRRRLRRCLDDWLNMYHHGYNADVVPEFKEHLKATGWRWRPLEGATPDEEQGPLSTWVECQTCATMVHHLLLGFELELYEPFEYDMIYWYCDYLCTCMVGAYTAILQRCPPPQPPKAPPQAAAGAGAGAGRGRGRGAGLGRGLGNGRDAAATAAAATAAMARYEKEQLQIRYEVLEVEAMQQLCQGMLRLMVGLKLAGAVPEHREPPPFNSGVQRFDQRFSAFAQLVRPPPLSHADYLSSMDPGGREAGHLLMLAGISFKEARARCAALKSFAPSPDVAAGWVRGLERAAAMNAVVAGVLGHKLGEGGKVKWDCDWTQHPYFPAISLPKVAATAAAAAPPAATAGGAPPAASSS